MDTGPVSQPNQLVYKVRGGHRLVRLSGRDNLGFRFNLLSHIGLVSVSERGEKNIGLVSSLREATQTGWPGWFLILKKSVP